jgi:hypothetical protein
MGTEDGNTSTYGTITSHAKYQFPIVGTGYLSVSGTYGSVNDQVSRVDFNKAWIKPLASGFDTSTSTSRNDNDNDDETDKTDKTGPYPSLEEVPDGAVKDVINAVGKQAFIDSFAVFPVSFLDDDLIVFDFELLGTRICAQKVTVV